MLLTATSTDVERWYIQLCCMVKQPHQHYITKLKQSKSAKFLINSSYMAKRGEIGWYMVNIKSENDRIMNVNEWGGLYMKSDVYNERLSEIGTKLIKRELKQ